MNQLTETFLGDIPDMKIFQHLVRYVREGYVETEEERMRRLLKVVLVAVQYSTVLN